uniref:NADH-ubiquinone oxidoreductase chain 2 n=1 Tax=Trachelipus rathkii TaxID=1720764 RepID=A0A0G2T4T8_9CRUS|nr:NADH dehydrogenase subunit 2 [Trachelipus rathkii]
MAGMLVGIWITIYSSSWVGVWMGLEMNLMCFIPFLVKGKTGGMACIFYFLAQATGSLLLLISGLDIWSYDLTLKLYMSVGLLLKAGVAPFHFWYPVVASQIKWSEFVVLSTLQKIAPLSLLYHCDLFMLGQFMYLTIIMSGVVGALGGLNELKVRGVLIYSSINHMGWVMMPLINHSMSWAVYFSMYCMMLTSVVVLVYFYSIYNLTQLYSPETPFWHGFVFGVGLFSLGGVPPFLGFFVKCWLLYLVGPFMDPFALMVLIFMSSITLFYYITLGIPHLIFVWENPLIQQRFIDLMVVSFVLFTSILGLWIMPAFVIWFM